MDRPFPFHTIKRYSLHWAFLLWALLAFLGTTPAFAMDHCELPEDLPLTRPQPPEGGPTILHVSFYLFDLIDIVTMKQEFTVDLFLVVKWKDHRIGSALREAGIKSCEIASEKVWRPGMIAMNERKKKVDLHKVLQVADDGSVKGSHRVVGTYSTQLDLRDFPLDSQTLSIIYISTKYSPEELKISFDSADTRPGFTESAWILENLQGNASLFDMGILQIEEIEGKKYSRFDIDIQVKRETAYYVWKVFIPLCLIVMVSWAVFWIDPSQMGIQTGIGTGMMLNIVAYLFSLQRILPKVPYLTRIDYFVYSSLIFVILAFFQTLVSCGLATRDHEVAAYRLDVASRFLFPLTFLAVILWFWQIW